MFGESCLPLGIEIGKETCSHCHASIYLFFNLKKKSSLCLVLGFERAATMAKAMLSWIHVDLKNKSDVSMGEGEGK